MSTRVAERIAAQSVAPGTVAIWWLGQNSYVLKGPTSSVMVDPFFSRPGPPDKYLHDEAPIAAAEYGPDAVFCTHNHTDHTDPGFLVPLAEAFPQTAFFGPPETAEALGAAGITAEKISAVEPSDAVELPGVAIQVLLSKTPEVSDVAHYGYLFDFNGARVWNTGDIMRGVTREPSLLGPVQRAAPHVALITTSPTEKEFPDFEEAAALARAVGARVAVPAHYNCFARRTFDPEPFAEAFADSDETRAVIIPYCGCLLYPPTESTEN